MTWYRWTAAASSPTWRWPTGWKQRCHGFDIERIDYADDTGVAKRALVAHRGPTGGIALSGHMDTVPDTGWQEDPWSAHLGSDGILHGLGSTDMKGPVAATIVAARALPERVPITLLITTDEETTKQGARLIAQRSELVRRVKPAGIIVAEPTSLVPVRGHRSHIAFTCVATGVQAHSSTGRGRNANWELIPFLMEMKGVFERLRSDASLQDPDYDPPFSDFNVVIDNHGAAVNVTVPKATARIKFRYSAKMDPTPVLQAVQDAAGRFGIAVSEAREGFPPELPPDHQLVRLCVDVTRQARRHRALRHRRIRTPGDRAVRRAGTRRHSRGTHADREGARRRPHRRSAGVHGAGRALSAGLRRSCCRPAAHSRPTPRRDRPPPGRARCGRRSRSGNASHPSSCHRRR